MSNKEKFLKLVSEKDNYVNNRMKALEWWSKLDNNTKKKYYIKHFIEGDKFSFGTNYTHLTGRLIEGIWEFETNQVLNIYNTITKKI